MTHDKELSLMFLYSKGLFIGLFPPLFALGVVFGMLLLTYTLCDN